eukprot:2274378-Pyramimonas_sp.AAC.2
MVLKGGLIWRRWQQRVEWGQPARHHMGECGEDATGLFDGRWGPKVRWVDGTRDPLERLRGLAGGGARALRPQPHAQ